MLKTIIPDTSCLIILAKIGALHLLNKIYHKVDITEEIAYEFADPLPNWIAIKNVKDFKKQKLLEFQLDKGESSTIALAIENPKSVMILDDYKARKIAEHLGLIYTGTIGVLIKAKLEGVVPAIKPYLYKIKQTNFHISEELEFIALQKAKEK